MVGGQPSPDSSFQPINSGLDDMFCPFRLVACGLALQYAKLIRGPVTQWHFGPPGS